MHVVEPTRFPLDLAAQYRPKPHTLAQARTFLHQLGITNMVIVQPSIYGNDNACTLEGLENLGAKHGRAVVQFDPAGTSREQLREWHGVGVRGVRINFKSVGAEPTGGELAATLREYADAVREFGWALELYIALEKVPLLEPLVRDLGVKVIVVSNRLVLVPGRKFLVRGIIALTLSSPRALRTTSDIQAPNLSPVQRQHMISKAFPRCT